MSAVGPGAVFLHGVAEELRDVVQPGVLRVPDVLAVIVTRLERVAMVSASLRGVRSTVATRYARPNLPCQGWLEEVATSATCLPPGEPGASLL